jgi:hypothetical protein
MKVILLLYWISRGVYIREVKTGEFNGRRQAGARVRARSSHERDSEQNMSTESCWNAGSAVDGVGVLVNRAPHSTTPLTSETVRGIALHRAGITIMHSPPAKTTPSRVPLSPIASEVSHK